MKYLARKLSTFASLFIIVQRKYSPFIKKTKKLRKQIALLAGAFLIFGGPAMILSLINTKQANAWFDNNWAYRRTVPVSSHQSSEKNVYIVVTLDTSDTTKFKSDCSDLRFTNQNGTLLPYIISSGCNTESTIIHIMLEDFPKGEQTIYYYYGNPSAKPLSSVSPFPNEATNYTIGTLGNEENGDAPISYWKFDEGTGTTANDSSSNRYNASFYGTNNPIWKGKDECISNKCIAFDGTNYAKATTPSLSLNAVTLSYWIKPAPGWDAWDTHVAAFDGYKNPLYCQFKSSTSTIYCAIRNNNNQNISISSNISIPINIWSHIEFTYDGSNLRLYINGISVATPVSQTGTIYSFNQIFIGSSSNYSLFTKALFEEVKIYSYARSANQVKADYLGSARGSTATLGSSSQANLSNGLVAYWKMDEESWNGTSGEVKDSSGNGNNGRAMNGLSTTPGKFGNGGYFDGTDDWIEDISQPDTSTNPNKFTISGYIKPDNQSGFIIAPESYGRDQRLVYNNTYQRLQVDVAEDTDTNERSRTSTVGSVPLNIWTYFTVTINDKNIKIYINGSLNAEYNETINIAGWSNDWNIGQRGSGTFWYKGSLDELRIYNRELTPGEVSQLYNFSPGPIAHYTFEEGSGNTVGDISGNGNEGIWGGSGSHWTAGKYGKAGNFNGVDDYVDTNLSKNFFLNNSYTISGWIKRLDNKTQHTILSYRQDPYAPISLSARDNRFWFYGYDSNKEKPFNISGGNSKVGEWYYVSGIVDYSTNQAYLYVNGTLIGKSNIVGTIKTTTATPTIGRNYWDGSTFGNIDDLRIYNYARTPKQIIEDMNAGHPVGGSPVGSQIGYWKFDEGYGTTTHDTSPQKINGTLSGTTKPSWSNAGKFGKALSFDGSSSYVSLGNISAYKTDNKTISFWAKPNTSFSTYTGVISAGGAANWYTGFHSSGRMIFSYSNSLCNQVGSYSDNNETITNEWHYYAYSIEASGSNVTVNFYRDGKLLKSNAYTSGVCSGYGTNFMLGAFNTSGQGFYSGLLDEVKIYNSALTAEEIKIDYNRNAATVMGALGTDASGNPSNSADRSYCPPGDTTASCGPVAEWNFEEGQGSTVNDTSGNNNTGTWNGTGSHWTQGQVGKGGNFNGIDDYVSTSKSISSYIPNGSSFTFSFWTNPKNQNGSILGTGTDSSNGVALNFTSGNVVYLFINGSGTWENGQSSISAQSWNHVVFVYNSSTTYGYLYINGVLKDSDLFDGGIKSWGTYKLNIGNSIWANNPFNGALDQVRIYDYARTPAQIAWDYNKGAPIAHWKLDECQGTTIHSSNDVYDPSLNGTINVRSSGSQTTTGTCNTSGTAWGNGKNGKLNSSLNFDGGDDYVSFNSSGIINPSAGAVSLWFNPSANQIYQGISNYIFSHPQTLNNSRIYINTVPSGNKVLCRLGTAKTIGEVSISPDNWHHTVCVWNGTSARFYVDGVDKTLNNSFNGLTSINSNFYLGHIHPGGEPFTGQIDDVQIYNYPLTAQQVKQIYNNGAVQYGN